MQCHHTERGEGQIGGDSDVGGAAGADAADEVAVDDAEVSVKHNVMPAGCNKVTMILI